MAGKFAHELDNKRGYEFPAFDIMRAYDPAYDDARRALVGHNYVPTDPLIPVKYHELIAAAILASRFYPSVDSHFRRALREGATMIELIEAIEAAAVPGGGPTLHFALGYLSAIEQEQARSAQPASA